MTGAHDLYELLNAFFIGSLTSVAAKYCVVKFWNSSVALYAPITESEK